MYKSNSALASRASWLQSRNSPLLHSDRPLVSCFTLISYASNHRPRNLLHFCNRRPGYTAVFAALRKYIFSSARGHRRSKEESTPHHSHAGTLPNGRAVAIYICCLRIPLVVCVIGQRLLFSDLSVTCALDTNLERKKLVIRELNFELLWWTFCFARSHTCTFACCA